MAVVATMSSLLQWDLGQQHHVQPTWDWLDTMGCTSGIRTGVQAGFQSLILEQQPGARARGRVSIATAATHSPSWM